MKGARWAALFLVLGLPARAQDPASVPGLLGEIEAYDTQIGQLDAQIATLEATLASAEADQGKREAEAKAAEASVGTRTEGARSLVTNLYRIRRFGMLRLLFGAEDPVELRRRVTYLRAALSADEARTTEFATLAAEKRTSAAAAEAANASTRQLRDQLAAQREGLETERGKRTSLLRDLRSRPSLAGQYVTETSRAREAFDATIHVVDAPTPAAAPPGTTADFRTLRGKLPRPVSGRLLHGYGGVVDPVSGARSMNNGLDWAAEAGAPFRSVAAGTVIRAGYVRGFGQMVMVQHGTFSTLYAHASSLRVTVDQAVKAGDTLGTVGTTGLADDSSPVLHFELRYNGTPQDPTDWLAP